MPYASAQTPSSAFEAGHKPDADSITTFFLVNSSDANDLNNIQTSLRNMIPRAKIFGDSSHYAITVRGTAEEIDAAQKLIAELDRPQKVYRLTYTITDIDAGKRAGAQHLVLLAIAGQRSTFKQGDRVPVTTAHSSERGSMSNEVQYVDTGITIEAMLSGAPDALSLHSRIVQSSQVDNQPANAARDPQFRQTALDESFQLTQGKPLLLGSFDSPGSARRQEIEVVAEQVR